jgi:hypothetical protein
MSLFFLSQKLVRFIFSGLFTPEHRVAQFFFVFGRKIVNIRHRADKVRRDVSLPAFDRGKVRRRHIELSRHFLCRIAAVHSYDLQESAEFRHNYLRAFFFTFMLP